MSVELAAERLHDSELIGRSLTEPEAFAAIFDRHFARIHRYLARRVGADRADDLASQTFTTAFQSRRRFDPAFADARPWLFGIATNLLRNERRSEQRLLETTARIARETTRTGASSAGSAADGTASLDTAIAAVLMGLTSDQRDVLLLHAWGELSYEEIAAALRVRVGTVRSRLARARVAMRAALEADARATTKEGQ